MNDGDEDDNRRRPDAGPRVFYKLTYEPLAQVSLWSSLVMFISVHDHCLPFTSTIIKEKKSASHSI